MRNKILTALLTLGVSALTLAQTGNTNKAEPPVFELGSGLKFNFNNGDYQFGIGGMIQPYIGIQTVKEQESDYFLNSKRSYFNISGKAVNERVDFFLQTDFSLGTPLLDAWLAYHPIKSLELAMGQKQNIANNREMLLMEDHLQFADRSLLSRSFTQTGREFGIFISNDFKIGEMSIIPQIAITSGDGRNSFGADSRDVDLGGFKYAARLDIYPLGKFAEGNDKQIADLGREAKPKFVIGGAASYNDGATNATGEGHGDFLLYNANGQNQLPDYRKLAGDVLFKYQGFSVLGEYVIGTAKGLQGAFTNAVATDALIPTQISEFLILGTSLNTQLGYVTKSGYGLDFRFTSTTPEFSTNTKSILMDANSWSVGATKYVKGQNLKLHVGITNTSYAAGNEVMMVEFLTQVVF